MNSLITDFQQEGLTGSIGTVPLDYALVDNTEQIYKCSEQQVQPLKDDTRTIGHSREWTERAHGPGRRWKFDK
jgi:hypothetical protein|tara:strand:+ start:2173 stop:2391 length:219 start_codon:yes stop_codon:yes gene_type:complete